LTSATILLDTRRKTKNGYPIKIRVQNRVAKYIHLNEYCDMRYWKDTVLPSHPDYKRLKAFLLKRESDLIREVDYCNEHRLNLSQSIEIIKNGLEENTDLKIFLLQQEIDKLRKQTGIGLIEFYDIRIEELKKINRSISAYVQCRNEFYNYLTGNDININSIDYDFLNGFINFKLSSGTCKRAGVNYYLKNLRAVYKEAQRRTKYNVKQDNPFIGLIKKTDRKETTLPTLDELREIFKCERKKAQTKKTFRSTKRNIAIFELQILLAGQDIVEISLLKWKSIKNGRISFKRHKLQDKERLLINNILCDRAMEIINEYGTKEDERIFGFIPDIRKNVRAYNNWRKNYYNSLKRYNPILRTKLPRYIFNSYAYSIGVQKEIVERLQGHKSKGETFTYSQRLNYDLQDREHLRVLELI
jgi:integrase